MTDYVNAAPEMTSAELFNKIAEAKKAEDAKASTTATPAVI